MTLDDTTLPYPGLRAFRRDESMLFFGRENCVDAMIERLAATNFLAVLGASGSGKSSLVRTGLFDGLELGFFARAGARWKIVETHPGGAPMRNLAGALARASDDGDQPADIEALLVQGRRSLIEWAGGTRLAPGENLLVLVDQFEELFRYADYSAREEAESFVAMLLESARDRDLPIYVAITMRSEFLGACALIPGLAEQINAGFYLTPRMSREECRQAIEGPAAVSGFDIEPSLTNRILNDMAALAPWEEERGVVQGQILSRRADQLPLMQHLLNRLWLRAKARTSEGAVTLTVTDYEHVGGLKGALDAHGAEILATLSPEDRALTAEVFRALVSGPDTTNAVRRPCRFEEIDAELLAADPASVGAAGRIVEAFRTAGCDFLQPGGSVPLSADTVIDISHESLIRQWSSLSIWLTDEAQAAANWRRLSMAADANRRGEGDLLSGLDLATLQQWWWSEAPNAVWAERHGGPFDSVSAFLEESRRVDAKQRSRDRRGRLILAGLVLVLAPSLILLAVTSLQSRSARAQNDRLRERNAQIARDIADKERLLAQMQTNAAAREAGFAEHEAAAQQKAKRDTAAAIQVANAASAEAKAAKEQVEAARQAAEYFEKHNPGFTIAREALDACKDNSDDPICDRLRTRMGVPN